MITRIVKLHFRLEEVDGFLVFFETVKDKIRAQEGCYELRLLKELSGSGIIFTYSKWESQAHLDRYRHSALFASTWKKTKALFAAKPEAWSTEELHKL